MARLSPTLVSSLLLLFTLPSVIANAACAQRYKSDPATCMEKCTDGWGFPGMVMGLDPWGTVMRPTNATLDEIIASACGSPAAAATAAKPSSTLSLAGNAEGPATTSINYASIQAAESLSASLASASSASVASASAASASAASAYAASASAASASAASAAAASAAAASAEAASAASAAFAVSFTPAPSSSADQAAPASSSAANNGNSNGGNGGDNNGGSSSGSSGTGAFDTSFADEQTYLDLHNSFRAQHGASALTWSNDLAAAAQQWASGCVFKHSGGTLGPYGENLAAGTGSAYDIAAGIASWTNEESSYNPNDPVPSHFTQVVWKGTSQLGCSLVPDCNGIFPSSYGPAKYIVCEYFPQGNIIGDFPQNVQV